MVGEKQCLLIVDDEVKMVRALQDYFRARGYDTFQAYNGAEAMELYYQHSTEIDLIILDIMMPVCSGWEVLEELRNKEIQTPVIMLTARGEDYDQIMGLQKGAEDYVVKPFSPAVLEARVEVILKRMERKRDVIQEDNLMVHIAQHAVRMDDQSIEMTRKEFDLLVFLLQNKRITFTRNQLLNQVWGYDFTGDIRTVDTHIKQLRMKLKQQAVCIQTIHGVGYKWEGNREGHN